MTLGRYAPQIADAERVTANTILFQLHSLGQSGADSVANSQSKITTISDLADIYVTDLRSPYQKVRHSTKGNYKAILKRLKIDYGQKRPANLKRRDIENQYAEWTKRGEAMAHALVTMLRGLANFGADTLEDSGCEHLAVVLHKSRFKAARSRQVVPITAQQATAIIDRAHKMGYHSIALAQALQFDCKLRQKDVIGEWIPLSEPGNPDLICKNRKWVRGLRWSQIDENLILRHTTSWGEKPVEINLHNARLVLAEFSGIGVRPLSGPMIVYEGGRGPRRPYSGTRFRSLWRKVANAAGIPAQVKNMDIAPNDREDADELER